VVPRLTLGISTGSLYRIPGPADPTGCRSSRQRVPIERAERIQETSSHGRQDERVDSPQEGAADAGALSTSRLESFSDGVMAVIITITAFELKAPNGGALSDLTHRFPALLVYMLSFVFIGIYWNNHHHLLRATTRISGAVMWANMHLLFWLSLIPVMTDWVGEEYHHSLPAAAYGVVDLGAAIAYSILVRAIIGANGRDSLVAEAIGSDVKGIVSPFVYAAGIGLAFASPWIAYGLYALVALLWLVPDRRISSRLG